MTILASPRLVALNNEPAIVKTDAFTLSVTPQIAGDGVIMLSLSPMLSAPSPNASDTLARVADGETIVISGLSREREVKETQERGHERRLVRPHDRRDEEAGRAGHPADADDSDAGGIELTYVRTILRVRREAVQPDAGSEVSLSEPVARQRVRAAPVRHPPPRRLRRRHRRHRHGQDDALPGAARADRSDDVHGAGAESVPVGRRPAEADPPGLRRHLARRAEVRAAGRTSRSRS